MKRELLAACVALSVVAARGAAQGARTTWAVGAAFAQVTARHGAAGEGDNVRENSLEVLALAERRLATRGAWRLTGAVGPVLAFAAGCSAGGTVAAGDGIGLTALLGFRALLR